MFIEGYEILIEKAKWVDGSILYSPQYWHSIIGKLHRLIQNPAYPEYAQHGELRKIKRLRIGSARIYAKLYPAAKILTILACIGRSHIKRDERRGWLDFEFAAYLQCHAEEFLAGRFAPLRSYDERKTAISVPPITRTEKPHCNRTWTLRGIHLSEEDAIEWLETTRPHVGRGAIFRPDEFCKHVMKELERGGDRLLIPLPEGADLLDKKVIQEASYKIRRTLALIGKNYSVRWDQLSQKFLIVSPEKVAVYCTRHYGRQKAIIPS